MMRSTTWGIVARFLGTTAFILAILLLLGYLPTRRLAGDEGLPAMFAGCAVGLAASLVGLAPVLLARSKPHVEMVPAALLATAVRIGTALVLGVAVALSGLVEVKALLLWVVISHAGLLIADTRLSIQVLSKRELAEN